MNPVRWMCAGAALLATAAAAMNRDSDTRIGRTLFWANVIMAAWNAAGAAGWM